MSGKERVRIGIIGLGCWTHYAHIPGVKSNPDAELVAICQRSEDKLHEAAAKYDVPHAFTDYREMIDKTPMDGLIVSTPHNFHFEPTKYALEHDLHVLLEKPMVQKAEEGRLLNKLAHEKGKTLLVGHPLPYTVRAQQARDVIGSGALGEVKIASALFASPAAILYRAEPLPSDLGDYVEEHTVYPYDPSTYNDPEAGGGQGYTQVSHTANLIFWMTGRRAAEVSAMMNKDDYPVDAYDSISFKLDNGGLGTITSWGTVSYKQKGIHEFRIQCEEGMLLLDANEGTMSVRWQTGKTEDFSKPKAKDVKVFYAGDEDLWPRFAPARNLVDVILGKADPICTGEHGLYAIELVEAAYQSATIGQPVSIG